MSVRVGLRGSQFRKTHILFFTLLCHSGAMIVVKEVLVVSFGRKRNTIEKKNNFDDMELTDIINVVELFFFSPRLPRLIGL